EHTRTFQRDGGAAGVIVGAGSWIGGIEIVAVAGIVVAGHQNYALGLLRISAAQNGVDVGYLGRLGNAFGRRLDESIELHFEAATTGARIALELAFDPLAGGGNAVAALRGLVHGERAAVAKAHQSGDGMLNLRGGNSLQRGNNHRIGRDAGWLRRIGSCVRVGPRMLRLWLLREAGCCSTDDY